MQKNQKCVNTILLSNYDLYNLLMNLKEFEYNFVKQIHTGSNLREFDMTQPSRIKETLDILN